MCAVWQGFEDCLLLDELLTEHDMRLERVLPAYTELRHPDAEAICDLAMYNYVEVSNTDVKFEPMGTALGPNSGPAGLFAWSERELLQVHARLRMNSLMLKG